MQELSLSKTVIKLVWEGKEYSLSKPSVGRAVAFEKAMIEAGQDAQKSGELVLSFIVESGLPRDVLLEMDIDALGQIMTALMPAKKN